MKISTTLIVVLSIIVAVNGSKGKGSKSCSKGKGKGKGSKSSSGSGCPPPPAPSPPAPSPPAPSPDKKYYHPAPVPRPAQKPSRSSNNSNNNNKKNKYDCGYDIVDDLWYDADYNILAELLVAAGLDDNLREEGPFTIFAPNNDAFRMLGNDVLQDLKRPRNRSTLRQVLKYHVIPGLYWKMDLYTGSYDTLLEGKKLDITVRNHGENIVLNGNVQVKDGDYEMCNGAIHTIRKVLTIPKSNSGGGGGGGGNNKNKNRNKHNKKKFKYYHHGNKH